MSFGGSGEHGGVTSGQVLVRNLTILCTPGAKRGALIVQSMPHGQKRRAPSKPGAAPCCAIRALVPALPLFPRV